MAEGLAVTEVGHTADGLAQNDGWCQEVGKGPRIDVMIFCVGNAGNGAEEKTSLDSHAALPDEGDFKEVIVIVRPIEEEHIPETAADNTGETTIHGEVKYMGVPATAVAFHNIVARNACRDDAQHKEQAIGTDGEGTNKK